MRELQEAGAARRHMPNEKNEKNSVPSTAIRSATPHHHPLLVEGCPQPICLRSVARTARKPPRPARNVILTAMPAAPATQSVPRGASHAQPTLWARPAGRLTCAGRGGSSRRRALRYGRWAAALSSSLAGGGGVWMSSQPSRRSSERDSAATSSLDLRTAATRSQAALQIPGGTGLATAPRPPRRLACTPFGIAFVIMASRWARGKLVVGGPEGDVPFRGQERGPVGGVHAPLVFGTRFCAGSQHVPQRHRLPHKCRPRPT